MPMVGSKMFPYTKGGMAAAKRHASETGQRAHMNRGYVGLDAGATPYRPMRDPVVAPATYQVAGASNPRSAYTGSKGKPDGISRGKVGAAGHNASAKGSYPKSGVYDNFVSGMRGHASNRTTYGKKNNAAMSEAY